MARSVQKAGRPSRCDAQSQREVGSTGSGGGTPHSAHKGRPKPAVRGATRLQTRTVPTMRFEMLQHLQTNALSCSVLLLQRIPSCSTYLSPEDCVSPAPLSPARPSTEQHLMEKLKSYPDQAECALGFEGDTIRPDRTRLAVP